MSYNNKWSDRRDATGTFRPRLFLMFEVIIYISLLIVIHYAFHMPALTLLGLFVALYFFITSSLTRYQKVIQRQKYSKYK